MSRSNKTIGGAPILVALICFSATLILALPSRRQFDNFNTNNQISSNQKRPQENLQPEESIRNEIEDDMTAADLDLDGEATNNNDDLIDAEDNEGQDSNIENAKIEMSPRDKAVAAGHHHHHKHYPHGWLEMGAETGKKGAFKWHDKHPVGGKGKK